MCNKQLAPGEEFALKEDGLLCKLDNEYFEKHHHHHQQQQQHNNHHNHHHHLHAGLSTSSSTTTSCQNITNLQPPIMMTTNSTATNSNTNSTNPTTNGKLGGSGGLLKCDQHPTDYEDNQNCSSTSLAPLTAHQHLGPSATPSHIHPSIQQQQQINPNGLMGGVLQPTNSRLLNGNGLSNGGTLSSSSTSSTASSSSSSNSSSSSMSGGSTGNGTNGLGTSSGYHHGGGGHGSGGGHGHGSGGHGHHRKDKTTRVRTVLNEKQLHTLRTCYGTNPRPDALMKEQLVELTGLSPRVIRVWFQNKRCKDKKKTILIKQMQEQQKVSKRTKHSFKHITSSLIIIICFVFFPSESSIDRSRYADDSDKSVPQRHK
jgi:hypothetical protein